MCVNEGEFGAAGTVKSASDVRYQPPVTVNGFPYCFWRHNDVMPSLHCVESII